MSDTYGKLEIPVAAPADPKAEATGDPALTVWASFFKAYINAKGLAAWAKVYPRANASNPQVPPVLTTWTHRPDDETIAHFSERDLPALFIYRASGAEQKWEWQDGRVARDTITMLWVFPTGGQEADRIRVPFVNALVKLIDDGIESYRDPSWVYPGDPDPIAATLAANPIAVRLAGATQTSPVTWAGAQLDGATGNATFAPARAAIVVCSGSAGAFVVGSTVSITGLNVLGLTHTRTITITGLGTFATDYAFTKITSVTVAAQTSTAGVISVGLGAYQGYGSVVLRFAPQGLKRAGTWKAQPITIMLQTGDVKTPRYYDALEVPLEMFEVLTRDLTRFDPLNGINALINGGPGAYEQDAQFDPP